MFQVQRWLDSLNLQNKYDNPKYDLASGELVAEIISRFKPQTLKQIQLYDANSVQKRTENWDFINKKLHTIDFPFTTDWKTLIANVVKQSSLQASEKVLVIVYQFLTGETVILPVFKQQIEETKKMRPKKSAPKELKQSGDKSLRMTVSPAKIYQESFKAPHTSINELCQQAYQTTAQQLKENSMYDIFDQLKDLDEELDDFDEDLKQIQSTPVYPDTMHQLFEFVESALPLGNIDLDAEDDLVCKIYFHYKFITTLESMLDQIISSCCHSLQREFTTMLRIINVYYFSNNDIVYVKLKDFVNIFITQLLSQLDEQNRKDSHYLQIVIHQIILMLPQEYTFATNQFVNTDIVLNKITNTHVLDDNFYGTDFYFMKNKLPSSIYQGVKYEFKRHNVLRQTSFVCTILSKILLVHPKVVAKMINSYIFQQMNISNYHLLNTSSKEYCQNLAQENENDDYVMIVTQQQTQLTQMNNLQLLFMNLLAEQFTFSYEYSKNINVNVVEAAQFFIFYAMQIDILKFDNTRQTPFIYSYLTKRKSMVVLYLDILTQLMMSLFLNTKALQETEDQGLYIEFIAKFSDRQNSQLSVIYKCVQILQRYIMGMSAKYLSKVQTNKGGKKQQKQGSMQEKLESVINNFICSESDQNIRGILNSASQMCENLYDIVERFVDMAIFLYSDRHPDTTIIKFLMNPPALEGGQIDEQFMQIYYTIQQLTNVCIELVNIIEMILQELRQVREDKEENKNYSLTDMDLDEEPMYACMGALHKQMKKLF
ncbi:hypothetical protein SS50377_20937 [Spironucleus salmonicida]|uniref:CH-like domain-containing protein n=1 Tax=Spironucleus salmonicida TaxID=348837 RepID=V6LGC7_9EUKA|nr:hypothetical protein SS50377_20937 [Spironucleus salmonicida]|eukprot:EST43610.1 hypothetical protein SS50377_16652 [Spironucleus salmonicida]